MRAWRAQLCRKGETPRKGKYDMKIIVTTDDITGGRRGDPLRCPVGLAVSRAGFSQCYLTRSAVIIRNRGRAATALLLPEAVQHWILAYEERRPVEPITFDLGHPLPVAGARAEMALEALLHPRDDVAGVALDALPRQSGRLAANGESSFPV